MVVGVSVKVGVFVPVGSCVGVTVLVLAGVPVAGSTVTAGMISEMIRGSSGLSRKGIKTIPIRARQMNISPIASRIVARIKIYFLSVSGSHLTIIIVSEIGKSTINKRASPFRGGFLL